MILPYNYWYFLSAIPPDICDSIIEHGLNKMYDQEKLHGSRSTDATTGDWKHKDPILGDFTNTNVSAAHHTLASLKKKGVESTNTYIRDSKVVFLNDDWLYRIIWPFVQEANKQAGWNWEWDFTENLQFTKYTPGQFYGWHADSGAFPYEKFNPETDEVHRDANGDPILDVDNNPIPKNPHKTTIDNWVGKVRKLSVTISLNDPKEYKGGNLRFDLGPHNDVARYHTCKEIRPKGSIIIFPSHTYHQVTPVTSGTRYSLVAWNLGKPFK